MPMLFDPLTVQGLTLRNRIMMSPMCQWVAEDDGRATDWHLVHYGARATGGAGLIMIEATAVEPGGRISRHDLGLWDDAQVASFARIAAYCHSQGAAVGVQLAHAGRKAWSAQAMDASELPVAPSAIPFQDDWKTPHALDQPGIDAVVNAFRQAARRALDAGLDVVEVHGAHGYLISEFLSPLTNRRDDGYGGDHAGRVRLAGEVVAAVRAEWPESHPLFLRLSCTDWAPGGNAPEDAVAFAALLKGQGVDLIDCSSGGVVNVRPPATPGYQVRFAEQVRREAGMRVAAVGLLSRPEQANAIVEQGQADLVALGRSFLRMPYWPHYAARTLGVPGEWPEPYATVAQTPVFPER